MGREGLLGGPCWEGLEHGGGGGRGGEKGSRMAQAAAGVGVRGQ